MMLKEGMAVVYEAGGAEYGPWGLEGLKKVEAQARYVRRILHSGVLIKDTREEDYGERRSWSCLGIIRNV